VTATEETLTALDAAALAADATGGGDMVALDVSDRLALADAFLIVTGRNERNVSAVANEIEDKLFEMGIKPLRREGRGEGRWVLIDFGGLIVHVFHEEDRLYYGLERLWGDCPVLPLPEGIGSRPAGDVVI
jgi:ribosome-associated protein